MALRLKVAPHHTKRQFGVTTVCHKTRDDRVERPLVTFQAIRIEVNRELEILPGAVDDAITATKPGGRVAVLTYHSGEDRIVKSRFRHGVTGGCTCPPALPCVCDAVRTVRLVKAPATPRVEEIAENRRAESARLRVVERIADAG